MTREMPMPAQDDQMSSPRECMHTWRAFQNTALPQRGIAPCHRDHITHNLELVYKFRNYNLVKDVDSYLSCKLKWEPVVFCIQINQYRLTEREPQTQFHAAIAIYFLLFFKHFIFSSLCKMCLIN